jgi:hypothetical protein
MAGHSVESTEPLPGALLFVRYAFPPNELGYCGPSDSQELLGYGTNGVVDRGLGALARQFDGAWPYLELIAGAVGIPDPLDRRVVEAYWVGNSLLDRIGTTAFGNSMEERFRRRSGQFSMLAEGACAGGVPHHSFHVFGVYPWVGMLGDGRKSDTALTVLDRCRIRWGQVDSVDGDTVLVRSRPLTWDGQALTLGEPVAETVTRSVGGSGFLTDPLAPGDWVSLHWDWVCDRLDARQLANLRRYSRRQLEITNHKVAHPGPAMLLG